MDLGRASLRYRTSLLVLTLVFVVGGLLAYLRMGRLEDPEFTIKQAQVVTPFPGASAEEVESQVTDLLERALQQLGQVDSVRSTSANGLSTIDVIIKDNYGKKTLPQVWDEVRRKVSDAQRQLPQGAGPSVVYDDYGDVYGIFLALTGDGYSPTDLRDVAKYLQRELLTVNDVARISLVGVQSEVVYLELSPARMSSLGITRGEIFDALQRRSVVVDSGVATAGGERIALRPTGAFPTAESIGDLLVSSRSGNGTGPLVYLRDIATVTRGYREPPGMVMNIGDEFAVGLAVSTVKGGNVVEMGNALQARLDSIVASGVIPFGVGFHKVSMQSEAVTVAIDGFVVSLLQAVVIVIVVLLLFMGLRSGLIIGAVLLATIIGSFVFMYGIGIMLERISLGALVIALGMLVDNAIVVTEGMLIRIQRGEDRTEAASAVVKQNQWPLLGATLVAILAFAAIGASNDSSGEYTRSLFLVIMISLLFSWATAVTPTPLLCAWWLKPATGSAAGADPYAGVVFRVYRTILEVSLRRRWLLVGGMVALLVLSVVAFGRVRTAFFPDSTRPQLMVDLWLAEGSDPLETAAVAAEASRMLRGVEGVTDVASFVGQGPPRYLLTLAPEAPNTAYAHLLVSFDDYRRGLRLLPELQRDLEERFPQAIPQVYKFALGPGVANKIQIRVSGPDPAELRRLASEVMDVMHSDGGFIGVQTDWRDRVKEYRPVLRDSQARQLGIDRPAVGELLKESFEGRAVGSFREGNEVLPVIARAPREVRGNLGYMDSLEIQSPALGRTIPLRQVVSGYELVLADSIIKRRDRVRTITVKGNPRIEAPSVALARVMPAIDAIEVPAGYALTYGGEYEDSRKANAALANKVLFCGVLMILIVILLFNSLRQPLIIWLCVPLSIIGVAFGLLATDQPFGFMALLGLLSLSGMLIKNAIVLVDEIDLQLASGKGGHAAIIDSGLSRARPVMMAALTTVLGMLPLVVDAFFVAMAVTIMAGLAFATVLTLVVVPVLYAIMFGIHEPAGKAVSAAE
jgi:multidrug efflux pump subunit AcrB